ncbi:MAG: hypothetical protein KDC73_13880 [Ignavibacteriae bacterium]|nr:hypothetical protein [Ignavibacteriota bacterium]MCB9244744.1 hypothetical protein [Ignavibacteriales bacterium]
MNNREEHLDTLSEIRTLMERSSRCLSLSGMSGISAGIIAILGAVAVSVYHGTGILSTAWERTYESGVKLNESTTLFYIGNALVILVLAVSLSVFFTVRKARKNNLKAWDSTTKRMLVSLMIPLGTGGIFCLILLMNWYTALIAPSMLIFYGLALVNASKYAIGNAEYLGIAEIVLGLVSMFYPGWGLLFWMIGFGVLHIIYGIYMYLKYEK